MTKRKYCNEFTEHRQYKCCECGRTMHEPTPHICNGQYRKHKLHFVKYEKDRNFPQDMLKSKDIQAVKNSLRISIDGKEVGYALTATTSNITAEPTKHPMPTNISFSVDMDKEKFDGFVESLRLLDESIKLRRDIEKLIQAYTKKRQKKLGNPLYYLYYKVNRALTYLAIIKKLKQIFGI